jgi:hypothetical protein
MTKKVSRRVWSAESIRALGASTTIETAGQILGMGRSKSYEMAKRGRFPVPVLRHGHRYLVPVAPLLRWLLIDTPHPSTDREGVGATLEAGRHDRTGDP